MPGPLEGCLSMLLGSRNDAKIDGRLGKFHLGRYAYEDKIPDWLHRLLEDKEKQHLDNAPSCISDILCQLLERDGDVETASLCYSATRYVGKIKVRSKDEGDNFCGYHNIQMLFSYVNAAEVQRLNFLAGSMPTIREIQDMIEQAWDQGFNESGRVQTGGIRGTRKHIGTPEVQALFSSLKIPCKADRFENIKGDAKAYEQLLDSVAHYFSTSVTTSPPRNSPKVQRTGLPPIYLQRPRHSMTIVGIEKRKGGCRNLLVFDPAYKPSKEMSKLLSLASTTNSIQPSSSITKPYRRGKKYLKR